MSLDTIDPYWTKSYAPNVPKTLEMDENASFSATIDNCLKKYADRTAVQCLGASWSYARLDTDSQAFAAALQALDLAAGARVAIMMPSIPQYLVAMLGVLRAGLIVVNVNPLYTPHELKHQLTDSGAEAIIVLAQFAATLQEVKDQTNVRHVIVTSIGDVFGGLKGGITNLSCAL